MKILHHYELVQRHIRESKIRKHKEKPPSVRSNALSNGIETESGWEIYPYGDGAFPGLLPSDIGTNAEIEALKAGVAAIYPDIEGVPELKRQASRL